MSEKGPFAATTLISLLRDHPSWCDAPGKPDPDCRATLGRARSTKGSRSLVKRDGADMSQWRWGHEHVALLQHKVYSHIPLLDRVSDLSVPSSGGFYTLDRGGGFDDSRRTSLSRARTAPAFAAIYDLADPDKSRFMITTGESGHIFSPHYRDFVAAVDRRQVDHARGERGRSEARRRAGAHLHAAVGRRRISGGPFPLAGATTFTHLGGRAETHLSPSPCLSPQAGRGEDKTPRAPLPACGERRGEGPGDWPQAWPNV